MYSTAAGTETGCISQVGCLLNYELSTGLRVEWHHICKYSLFPGHWFLVKNLIRALQFSEFSAGIRVFNGVCRQLFYCIVLFAGTGFFKNMIGAEIQSARSQFIVLYIWVALCQSRVHLGRTAGDAGSPLLAWYLRNAAQAQHTKQHFCNSTVPVFQPTPLNKTCFT